MMKKLILASVLGFTATAALASGAPTDNYPYGFQPHADLEARGLVKPAPTSVLGAAKNDDSVKLVYTGDRDGADYNLFTIDNFRARHADQR
ncbi:hypothetical protein [Neisseria arctica]|nr:hypothetical protein [Neisseria arctica]UOO86252.1 hypothetical protein LVJ86_08505 [Neisseria arctica]